MALNHRESSFDWLVCDCGNTPRSDGFYPCLPDGTVVEPTPDAWGGHLYLCAGCNTVYDIDLMEEVVTTPSKR